MFDQDVPAGFAMALTRNEQAVNAYAMMTKDQKAAVLEQARQVRSKKEMESLMAQIARDGAF